MQYLAKGNSVHLMSISKTFKNGIFISDAINLILSVNLKSSEWVRLKACFPFVSCHKGFAIAQGTFLEEEAEPFAVG